MGQDRWRDEMQEGIQEALQACGSQAEIRSVVMRILEVEKMYCLVDENNVSNEIVRVLDHLTGQTYYAQWWGGNHGEDYLPGGALYIGDSWEKVMEWVGVKEKDRARLKEATQPPRMRVDKVPLPWDDGCGHEQGGKA